MKDYLKNYSVALSIFERRPALLSWFFAVTCLYFSNWAQMLLEVFIRKRFGIRYFYFAGALRLALVLAILPVLPQLIMYAVMGDTAAQVQEQMQKIPENMRGLAQERIPEEISTAPSLADSLPGWDYLTWYLFLAAFLYVSFRHRQEQKSRPSIIEKPTYTRYRGDINPFFYGLQFPWFKTTTRIVECYLEPAGFFVVGFFLYIFGQHLGMLLMFCSVVYCGAYIAGYKAGDLMVLNTIDNAIIRKNMEKAIVKDDLLEKDNASDTQGFKFRTRLPSDENFRKKVYDQMEEEKELNMFAR